MRPLLWCSAILLTGCATTSRPTARETEAEARGFERGYGQAVKEQYWIIQNQQRQAPVAASKPPTPPR